MSGYRQVADALRSAIAEGRYRPGDVLPRQDDIAAEHDVNIHTVRKAVDLLAAEGYVEPIRRRGTVVLDRTPAAQLAEAVATLRAALDGASPGVGAVKVPVSSLRAVLDALDTNR